MGLLSNIIGSLFTAKRRGLKTRMRNGYFQYKRRNGSWGWSHRRAAEKKLGGKILPGFVVHHRDGNKKNNSWWNLLVMPRDKHSQIHARKKITR